MGIPKPDKALQIAFSILLTQTFNFQLLKEFVTEIRLFIKYMHKNIVFQSIRIKPQKYAEYRDLNWVILIKKY